MINHPESHKSYKSDTDGKLADEGGNQKHGQTENPSFRVSLSLKRITSLIEAKSIAS